MHYENLNIGRFRKVFICDSFAKTGNEILTRNSFTVCEQGEDMADKEFMNFDDVNAKCLCVPHWFMAKTEKLKHWTFVRLDLGNIIPDKGTVFKRFLAGEQRPQWKRENVNYTRTKLVDLTREKYIDEQYSPRWFSFSGLWTENPKPLTPGFAVKNLSLPPIAGRNLRVNTSNLCRNIPIAPRTGNEFSKPIFAFSRQHRSDWKSKKDLDVWTSPHTRGFDTELLTFVIFER